MRTRNLFPLVELYGIINLSHARLPDARTDLLALNRRFGENLALSIRPNAAGTRGIVKIVLSPDEEFETFTRGKPWRAALQSLHTREEVQRLIQEPEWAEPQP